MASSMIVREGGGGALKKLIALAIPLYKKSEATGLKGLNAVRNR